MKKFRLILAITVVMMMLLQSVAFAAMPNGTVVIGDKAYSLSYVNDAANADAISAAIAAAGSNVFVKGFTGNWVSEVSGSAVVASEVPAVDYLNADGTTTHFSIGDIDNDTVAPTIATGSAFTDSKTIKVPFSEKVKGTPVVTINGTAEAAANVVVAEDGKSLTITRTAAFAAGNYLVIINGLKDMSDNAMVADTSVGVVKAASALTTITFTSTAMTKDSSKITFKAFDQFGAELTTLAAGAVSFGATYNGAPISDNVLSLLNKFNVTFTSAFLVKDRQIVVTAKNAALTTTYGTATLTVSDSASSATSISDVVKDVSTVTAGKTAIALTATVLDQFGNIAANVGVGGLRWVTSDKSVVAFNTSAGSTFLDGANNTTLTMSVDALKEGTATLTAYLPNGSASASITITVVPGSLSAITAVGGALTVTNKAVPSAANATVNGTAAIRYEFTNSNAAKIKVLASAVTTSVTATSPNVAADVTVEKIADADGYLTGLKISTNRTNSATASVNYTLTVTSGGLSATRTITSDIDGVAATLSAITVGTSELSATANLDKAFSVLNQYGEVLPIANSAITVTSSSANLTVTKLGTTSGAYVVLAAPGDVVTGLRFNASAAGTYTVLVSSGVATRQYTITAVAKAQIATVTLGNSTTVVKGDQYADTFANGYFVKGGLSYKLMAISALNQYGSAVNIVPADISTSGSNITYVFVKANGSEAAAGESVAYVGVNSTSANSYEPATVSIVAGSTSSGVQIDKAVAVSITAARKVKSITVSDTKASLLVNGTVTQTVTVLDQYGKDITKYSGFVVGDIATYLTATSATPGTATVALSLVSGVIKATYTGVAVAASASNVTFATPAGLKDASYAGDVVVPATVYGSSAIASIAITNTEDANGYATLPLFGGVVGAPNPVALGTLQIAYTVTLTDGTVVSLPTNSSMLLYASSVTGAATVDASGLISAVALGASANSESTITVATVNGKTDSIKVKVQKDNAVLALSSLAITTNPTRDDDSAIAGTQLKLANGATCQLAFSGKDQYGFTVTRTTQASGTTWATSNISVATVDVDGLVTLVANGTVTITAVNSATFKTIELTVSGF